MGGGGTTTSDTTSNQINQIPAWMSNAGQQNYAYAQQVAQQPLQQYQGQMVADVAPQTQQAWNVAANSGNVGSDQYNAATAGYLGALGQTPQMNTAYWAGKAPNTTSYWAGKAPNTVAQQGILAAPTTAATAGNAQQAASSKDVTAAQSALSQLSNTNLQPYMNPYTESVINKTLPIMQQGLAQSQNQQQNAANSANAYGGSRQGIQQGVTQAQGALAQEQMAAQLNAANFAQAQAAGEFDVTGANQMGQFNANQLNQVGLANQQQANLVNTYNAGQGNQVNLANAGMLNQVGMYNQGQANQMSLQNAQMGNQVGMYNQGQGNQMAQFNAGQANQVGMYNQGQNNTMSQFNAGQANQINTANQAAQQARINSGIQAAYGLTNTGQSMNAANAANYNMLQGAGAGQSMQAQNQINAQMAKFNQAFNYPQQQLGVLEGSLGMTPHDTSQSGQSSTQTTTPTDWASLIKGGGDAAASVLGMFGAGSDRSMKTDITKLGKDPKTGLQMHAYRYKGDPKSYPKVVGPMAQEVQEKYPDKAKRIGGKLTVDPSMMAEAGVQGFAAGTPFVGPSLAAFVPPSSRGVAKGIGALSAFRPPTRLPRGLGVPRMQKFADGAAQVPGRGADDTVPAMLTPGEAVLNRHAAQQLGRGNIAALNARAPMGIAGGLANLKRRPKIAGGLSGA